MTDQSCSIGWTDESSLESSNASVSDELAGGDLGGDIGGDRAGDCAGDCASGEALLGDKSDAVRFMSCSFHAA
jgi:hypothetical protein